MAEAEGSSVEVSAWLASLGRVESAIRDVCRLAARDRGFEYKGYLRNTLTFGYITDPKNICKLGIVD